MIYSIKQIAHELHQTAMGVAFHGNALRVAKDIDGVTPQERSLLDRFATGGQGSLDHIALQDLAIKIQGAVKKSEKVGV